MSTKTARKTKRIPPLDVVGLGEIAELLDVKQATAWVWRTRGDLPEPDAVVSKTPIWRRERILEWARVTGRLSD